MTASGTKRRRLTRKENQQIEMRGQFYAQQMVSKTGNPSFVMNSSLIEYVHQHRWPNKTLQLFKD